MNLQNLHEYMLSSKELGENTARRLAALPKPTGEEGDELLIQLQSLMNAKISMDRHTAELISQWQASVNTERREVERVTKQILLENLRGRFRNFFLYWLREAELFIEGQSSWSNFDVITLRNAQENATVAGCDIHDVEERVKRAIQEGFGRKMDEYLESLLSKWEGKLASECELFSETIDDIRRQIEMAAQFGADVASTQQRLEFLLSEIKDEAH